MPTFSAVLSYIYRQLPRLHELNMGGMLVYNSHILVTPPLCTCISLQHASKSYLKEKKKVFVFAFFIKPTCRLTEDHFRNRHSSVTWRKRNLFAHRFFAQEEVVDDEEEILPRGHDHGGAGETLSTALTTRSPPSRPKFSAGELVRSSSRRWIDGANSAA